MSIDTDRLKKLLLVALSSDQPGEAFAALSAINKQLKANKLDAHWLADKLNGASAPPPPKVQPGYQPSYGPWHKPAHVDWQEMLIHCADHRPFLRPREEEFIGSLLNQSQTHGGWYPSEKQLGWLAAIYSRLKPFNT